MKELSVLKNDDREASFFEGRILMFYLFNSPIQNIQIPTPLIGLL